MTAFSDETGREIALTRSEALQESAYIAGARAGWNLAIAEDVDGLMSLMASRQGYLSAISAATDAEQERMKRHGEHLFATAKSLGWKDDGEGPLNFIARHERERGALSAAPVAQEPVAWPDMRRIVENLDELDRQRTPGPWKKTHDNITQRDVLRGLVARCDEDWGSFTVDMTKASKNARFIVALENAWPKLRAALYTSPPATPAGLGADEIARALMHELLAQGVTFTASINLDKMANAILALLSRAGDQK